MMKYGYSRVSSVTQLAGSSLEEQEKQLKEAGAEIIYKDVYAGSTSERPEFQKLLSILEPGDEIKCCRLDRFARSAQDALNIVDELMKRDITIHILNMGVVDSSPIGKLSVNILAAFAEFERSQILERTALGKQVARQDPNYREGRPPKYSKKQLSHALELLAEGRTYRQVEELTGISKSTLIRAKRKQEIS